MNTENQVGNYSFIVGVIIAIVLGLAAEKIGTASNWLWLLLVVLGILVGALNVSTENSRKFLWLTVVLVVIEFAGSAQVNSWLRLNLIGQYLKGIFDSILAFIVPAGVVVALKEIWALAKPNDIKK